MRAYEFITEIFDTASSCVPLAIMRVTGMEPHEVQDFCMHGGWNNKGMTSPQYLSMVKLMGFDYKERYDLMYYEKKSKIHRGFMDKYPKTLNMLLKDIPNGKFLVSVQNHAVAIIDGKLYDDANVGRKHRIQDIYEVI